MTTGNSFEGYIIEKYIDVISSAVVLGTGFLSSISVSFSDFTGSRSGSYEKKLKSGEREALEALKERAKSLGGNGIIGIDVDYTTFGN
ncbi:MAG: heavy metal-binding domain-containing protein [Muricomes sp.]